MSAESEQRIAMLTSRTPHVIWTRRERIARTLIRLLLAIALMLGTLATYDAVRISACINTNLGARQQPAPMPDGRRGTTDAAEQIIFANWLLALLTAPPATDQAKAVRDAQKFIAHHIAVLTNNQQYRDKHPLGKC